MSKWTRVCDGLPPRRAPRNSHSEKVLAYTENEVQYTTIYDYSTGQFRTGGIYEGYPTHWMPLPIPPKS